VIEQVNALLLSPKTQPPPALEAALREKFQLALTYDGRFTVYLRR
jgi:hypothetical protein